MLVLNPLASNVLRSLSQSFVEPRPRVNTVKRGLYVRIPQLVNSFLRSDRDVDFFTDASSTYKVHVLKHIASF